ncbi:MAG TPA: hypothetical protein VFK20_04350 [Vicinamibacterales bacterium]|nr:hypothetical protein [Vicinamibacterales bacterium]
MLVTPYVRGAVSGLGLFTVLAGLVELAALMRPRREESSGGGAAP